MISPISPLGILIISAIFLILFVSSIYVDSLTKNKFKYNYFSFFEKIINRQINTKINNSEISKIKNYLYTKNGNYWDPVEKIDIEKIRENASRIEIKNNRFKKNWFIIDKYLKKGIFFIIILILIIFYFLNNINPIFSIIVQTWIPYIIITLIIIYYSLENYFYSVNINLIKLEIAKKKNWIYDPNLNKNKLKKMSEYFPEIFNNDNKISYIQDQFWENIEIKNKKFNFTSGIQYTEIETENSSSNLVQTKSYFIFPLNKKIKVRFHLYPKNLFSKINDAFLEQKISVESNDFNKIYTMKYNGEKNNKALEIMKILNPKIQEKLIELNKKNQFCEILFTENVVVFMIWGDLIENIKTDFRKNSEINADDLNEINTKLTELIKISEEMEKYLD